MGKDWLLLRFLTKELLKLMENRQIEKIITKTRENIEISSHQVL